MKVIEQYNAEIENGLNGANAAPQNENVTRNKLEIICFRR
jgi:hypothetical protein